MTTDRRRCPRFRRLIPGSVVFEMQRDSCTTLDASGCGGFLRTHLVVPGGNIIQVTLRGEHSSDPVAKVLARVARTVEVGSRLCPVPGLGVEWIVASCASGRDALLEFLGKILQLPPDRIDESKLHEGETPNVAVYYLNDEYAARVDIPTTGDLALPSASPHLPVSARRLIGLREKREVDRFWVRTEVVYQLDDLPHAGLVFNLSAKGAVISTQQRMPERNSTVSFRIPLTGPFSESWIRAKGRVLRYMPVSGGVGEGFVVEFKSVDEMGQTGVFAEYLEFLRREQMGLPTDDWQQ